MIGDINHIVVSGVINSEIKEIIKNETKKLSFTIRSEYAFTVENESKFAEHMVFVADRNIVQAILKDYKDGKRIMISGALSYYESEYKGKKTKYVNIYCGFGHSVFIEPDPLIKPIERGARTMRQDEMSYQESTQEAPRYQPAPQQQAPQYSQQPQYQPATQQPQYPQQPPPAPQHLQPLQQQQPPQYQGGQHYPPPYAYAPGHPQHPDTAKQQPPVAPSQRMIDDEIPF